MINNMTIQCTKTLQTQSCNTKISSNVNSLRRVSEWFIYINPNCLNIIHQSLGLGRNWDPEIYRACDYVILIDLRDLDCEW